MTVSPPKLDLVALEWAIEKRAKIQETILALYRYAKSQPPQGPGFPASYLLDHLSAASFSLWRAAFLTDLREIDRAQGIRLSAAELKAVVNALSGRDETAEICRDKDGSPEADAELRDTESVPLKEGIEAYFQREVLPHVPDAWIDHDKTKVGYEIPLNRHFYRYEPPRPLEEIEADIKGLENDILALLKEVTA